MADRYQDRPFPADDDYGRGANPHGPAKGESDPLAELARLIGQTDPFGGPRQPRPRIRCSRGPMCARNTTPWTRTRRARPPARRRGCSAPGTKPPPQPQYDDRSRIISRARCIPAPLRGPAAGARIEQDYQEPERSNTRTSSPVDPSRYDDALYGQLDPAAGISARSGLSGRSLRLPGGYEEEPEPKKRRKRR